MNNSAIFAGGAIYANNTVLIASVEITALQLTQHSVVVQFAQYTQVHFASMEVYRQLYTIVWWSYRYRF